MSALDELSLLRRHRPGGRVFAPRESYSRSIAQRSTRRLPFTASAFASELATSGPVMPLPGCVAANGSLAGNDISNSLESCWSSSVLDFRFCLFLDLRSCSVLGTSSSNRSQMRTSRYKPAIGRSSDAAADSCHVACGKSALPAASRATPQRARLRSPPTRLTTDAAPDVNTSDPKLTTAEKKAVLASWISCPDRGACSLVAPTR
jgi:hypothetical protein